MTRDRDLVANSRQATLPAKLPGLTKPRQGDWAGLGRWIDAVTEHLQVRQGGRGSPLEATVTRRELQQTVGITQIVTAGSAAGTVMMQTPTGKWTSVSLEAFAELIRNTRLYNDLMKAIDDPTRFSRLSQDLQKILLPDLNEIAKQRGADIQQFDTRVQDAVQSMASRVTEITSALGQVTAGIRQTLFTQATQTYATAAYGLQITARLDDIGGSTIEELFTVIADRATGLEAQYTLKLSAGGAIAGIGLAVTAPVGGTPSSAMIIQADKFAIVPSSYAGGLDNTPAAGSIPFGVDAITGDVYMSGNLLVGGTITSTGMDVGPSSEFQVDGTTGAVTATDFFGYNSQFGNTFDPTKPTAKCLGYAGTSAAATFESFTNAANTSSSAHAIRGANNHFGTSGIVGLANASFDFYAEGVGAYGPFTGAHDALVPNADVADLEPGDIVVDVGIAQRKNVSNTIFTVQKSSAANQKGALGVFVASAGPLADNVPAAMIDSVWTDSDDMRHEIMSGAYYDMADTHEFVGVNGVGEGQINVCGEAGDLEAGDLIVCSSTAGKGMKQADDIVRSYTVAKVREAVTFATPDEVKLVACVYCCG